MKHPLSLEQHLDAGRKIKEFHNFLHDLECQLVASSSKTDAAYELRRILQAEKNLNELRSLLEDRMFRDHKHHELNALPLCGLGVYYGSGNV